MDLISTNKPDQKYLKKEYIPSMQESRKYNNE